jgi:uncharacterized protein (TIRG00374 family)
VPAIAAVFTTYVLSAVRWRVLLKAQGFSLSWGSVLQLSFVGNFFNIALPGSVSGDFVKAYYAGKGDSGRVFGTILFDRIVGVAVLVLVSATAFWLGGDAVRASPFYSGLRATSVSAAVAVLVFFTYLFQVKESSDPLLKLLTAIQVRFPWSRSLAQVYLGVRGYHTQPRAVATAAFISAINHLMSCSSAVLFARALGEQALAPAGVFAVVPLGWLVTAVPIMPAGVGTGHAAFSALFSTIGSPHGADVFNLFILVQLMSAAIGGFFYLRSPELKGLTFTTSSRSS